MSFETLKLTGKGKELLLRSLEGQQLVFTSVHIGDGEISGPDAIPALEDLVSSIKSVDIIKAQRNTDYMTVEAYFKNDEIPRSFYWKELGVFVADPDNPDDRSADILFVYQNAYDTAEYISISTAGIIEKTVRVNVFVGEAENISAVIDSSVVFVTRAEFDDHKHTVSDIENFPESMPADGGNADTVNGHTVEADVPAGAQFTDTTYSEGAGISITGTTINNSGVRSVSSGSSNGTIAVNTNGTTTNVAVKGLASAAYQAVQTTASTVGLHRISSGSDEATTTNCPAGCWYGQYE